MVELFLDESGSMTREYCDDFPYFVICMVKVKDKKKLKKSYKYFIKKNFDKLKSIDKNNKMFKNNKFLELKGSALTKELKKDFVKFICKDNLFELFFSTISNKHLKDEKLYKNTARAFNFITKLSMQYFIHKKYLPINERYFMQIDERNQKTGSKNSMKDYLNTALGLENKLIDCIDVKYFDSSQNFMIQIADVFSNLKYSQLLRASFTEEFEYMKKNKYIKGDFIFPK